MTIEEKAQLYDGAIKVAMSKIKNSKDHVLYEEDIIDIFPELAESEDDKMKKHIIEVLKDNFSGEDTDKCIAWLEKQGKFSVQIHYWTEEEIEPIISDYLRGAENYGGMIGRLRCLKPKSFEKQGRQEQLYIRFGEIPTDEKSKIYQGEIEVGIENGVSVYPAFKTNEGDIVLGLTLPITKTTLYTQQYLIEYDDRPCYLVKGDYVGKDTDGQPLISNVSIVEKIDSYRIKEEKQGEKPQGKSALEVIKEEKVDNANKIEPKFHKGEWVVWNNQYYKVNYNGCGYELVDQNSLHTLLEYGTIDESAHLWNIEDAKDRDLLATDDGVCIFDGTLEEGKYPFAYCGITERGFESYNRNLPFSHDNNIHPATKEQRDTLMKAMADAGYTFDFKKKELKKIENKNPLLSDFFKAEYERGKADAQKPVEWSALDERNLQGIIDEIEANKNQAPDYDIETYDRFLNWLKSLRPQNTWKPTKEQMKALHDLNLTGGISYAGQGQTLIELYNDLKKL